MCFLFSSVGRVRRRMQRAVVNGEGSSLSRMRTSRNGRAGPFAGPDSRRTVGGSCRGEQPRPEDVEWRLATRPARRAGWFVLYQPAAEAADELAVVGGQLELQRFEISGRADRELEVAALVRGQFLRGERAWHGR